MHSLNPYLTPILTSIDAFLDEFPLTSEHTLIKFLQQSAIAPFDLFNLGHAKDLFNAHFLCMHALYHLKHQYATQQSYHLRIHAIQIERVELTIEQATHTSQAGLITPDPLEAYYLDSRHYFETQEEDIQAMLKSFWEKYLAQDEKHSSLQILELPGDADADMVQQQYRRLAQKHHPDKGGCAARFNEIRQAKDVLDKCFK